MLLFVFKIAAILLSLVMIHLSLSRFFHIFQLTFYNFTEFYPTIKKTREIRFGKFQLLLLLLVIVASISNSIFVYPIWIITIIINIYFIIALKPKEKKKFVITNRIKIMYIFSYIFEMVFLIIPCVYFSYIDSLIFYFFAIFLALYKYTALIFASLGNLVTKPVMILVSKKYIDEAREILKDNNMKIIGVTGSYGKTSTKNIINEILSSSYSTVMTPKSYNTTLGVVKTIREDIKPYTEIFVCEMGAARLGEISEICDIARPDYSIITSIGPQHLTSFKSIENVQKGKFEIVTNSKENSVAILNMDNEYIKDGVKLYLDGRKVIKYGIEDTNDVDYCAKNIKISECGSTFDICYDKKSVNVQTKLLGKHNIYNIVCAFATAKQFNIPDDTIAKAIKRLKPVEHRLELKKINDILVLDDSFNSNPAGSKMAIECLNMFENKYKVLVTPGMIELGSMDYELNKKLGEYACICDYVILVGDKNTAAIKDGLNEKNFKDYIIVKDVYEAFELLAKLKIEHENLIALIENDLPDSYS